MIRLPFRLKEFDPRITWASSRAQAVWEPRIATVSQLWQEVEYEAVKTGVKRSVLQVVPSGSLAARVARAAGDGLVAVPLAQVAQSASYASGPVKGPLTAYKVAITTYADAAAWAQAWAGQENDQIGQLLGYPDCCRAFFQRVWVEEKWFDTTVPQALHTYGDNKDAWCNVLWRWLGVRAVSHLPCGFWCDHTHQIGKQMVQVFREMHGTGAEWLEEILHWPVRYTSLHGLAEITTPILRMCVATDALAEKMTVDYKGPRYPDEGAQGGFPHKRTSQVHDVVNTPLKVNIGQSRQDPTHNGFQSREAQNEAHDRVLSVLPLQLYRTIVDLGCGNGALARKIPATRRVGVEQDVARAAVAQAQLDQVYIGDCQDRLWVNTLIAGEQPDLIIAQQDRNPPETLPANIAVLSYSYEAGKEMAIIRPKATFMPTG